MTELDCSDGAKMIIERMQTNPEDFNYGGKLYSAFENKKVSARDSKALKEAHDLYILEPRLMAQVLESLLAQPEKEDDPRRPKIVPSNQQRITREMYEDHIQTHKSPIKKHIDAVRAEKESIAAQIYNKAFGREKVERDN